MTYVYKLAGNDLELAEAELKGFLDSQNIEEDIKRNNNLAETESHPKQLKRLALTHEVIKRVDIDDYKPKGKYAVRAETLADQEFDKKRIENEVGEQISGLTNEVDLDDPDTTLKIYNTEEGLVYGELVEDIPRGLFEKRSNENRPFSSPISLDPVLARVMVNLSGVSAGEHILDPFCGTGGLLIEAGLCGVGVHGSDAQEEMIEGSTQNLEEYGIISYDLEPLDISDVEKIDRYNAIISDLPYGKASKKKEEPIEEFLKLIENFEGRTVFMYDQPTIGPYEADFEIYIHKSLTRYIYIN